ncbi:GNAT family N-acetyltransferase [Aridibaculum aurantiacum]|uniref:GNAT family N-acetyltransferase n=1 Tax=Aridibaculum aurantiacum TaxID=2810307 RepID=UPI001A96A1FE|nr:GNAT family N-acetyltransferase [Aridibaculum aurantiacum]
MNNHIPSSTDLVIRPASFNDIRYIQQIAAETWPVAYKEILSKEQLEYMLGLFYTHPALEQQMKDNHHFFLAIKDAQPIGFASFNFIEGDIYKLQKLYVLPTVQGTGAGIKLLHTVEAVAYSMGGKYLQLNVNRKNNAKNFYEKNGYKVIAEKDIDIGNGYWMIDFIMQKELTEENNDGIREQRPTQSIE